MGDQSADLDDCALDLRDVVTSSDRRAEFLASGGWDGSTLVSRLAAFAGDNPDKPAVIDMLGVRQVNFAELQNFSNQAAHMLVSLGVKAGDVVAVQMPNWLETVVVDIAVMKLGAVLNPMLPIYRAREVGHMLNVGRTRVIVSPDIYREFDYAAMVEGLRMDNSRIAHHVQVPDPNRDKASFWNRLAQFPDTPPSIALDADAVGLLAFTSGTEAQPKAVMQTENGMNVEMRALYKMYGMSPDDVVWVPSPVGHATGLKDGMRIAIYNGLSMVLQDKWSGQDAAELVQKFRCSYTVAATTFLRDLIEIGRADKIDLSSLRLFGSGGAPIPAEVVTSAAELGINVLRLYGGTEMAMVTTCLPSCPLDKRVHTDGRPLEHVEVQIRDEQGNVVIGAAGEIFARGPQASVGFFADPERTGKTYLDGGWIRSGDCGVLDADGYLTIVGRLKEIIIRGGMNIAPRELEDVMLGSPGVADVAVIGLPDKRLGEMACACIVLAKGRTLTFEQLVADLKSRGVAPYKLPQRMEIFEALPKTASGKIQKFQLVKQVVERGA